MEVVDFAAIMRDVMLPLEGQFCEDKWQRAFVDDESMLALLLRLAPVSKEWRDVVATLPPLNCTSSCHGGLQRRETSWSFSDWIAL